ncbi:uncharacterized protein ISCGN_023277 [Ixodes scapularis]
MTKQRGHEDAIRTESCIRHVESTNMIVIYSRVTKGGARVLKANVTATITLPEKDKTVFLPLHDSGKGADLKADDGEYAAYFTQYRSKGRYSVRTDVTLDTSAVLAISKPEKHTPPLGRLKAAKSIMEPGKICSSSEASTECKERTISKVMKFRPLFRDRSKIFYLDGTWVTAGHTVSRVWVDTTVAASHDAFMRGLSTGLKQPSGKGQRLIVTHIGSDEGFVDDCLDVFCGQKTGDYHEEMDGARFEKWLDGVLYKLPTGSVIVMDNASYHSRRLEAVPTTSSRRDDIRQWLTSKKISWDPKMVKKQLLDIVALVKPQHLKYRVDTAAETAGCTVVRLPPYHCEFNPIELIWAQIKNGVAARNTTFKIVDVGRLLNEEVDKVTTDNWINAVRHVIDIEATFRRGGATSAHIQPIIIQLDGEDTPSESDLSGVEPLDEA